MNNWTQGLNKLKAAWNENPVMIIAVGGLVMRSAASLINSISGVQSKRAYARSRGRR